MLTLCLSLWVERKRVGSVQIRADASEGGIAGE